VHKSEKLKKIREFILGVAQLEKALSEQKKRIPEALHRQKQEEEAFKETRVAYQKLQEEMNLIQKNITSLEKQRDFFFQQGDLSQSQLQENALTQEEEKFFELLEKAELLEKKIKEIQLNLTKFPNSLEFIQQDLSKEVSSYTTQIQTLEEEALEYTAGMLPTEEGWIKEAISQRQISFVLPLTNKSCPHCYLQLEKINLQEIEKTGLGQCYSCGRWIICQ